MLKRNSPTPNQQKEEAFRPARFSLTFRMFQDAPQRKISEQAPGRGASQVVERRQVKQRSGNSVPLPFDRMKEKLPPNQPVDNGPAKLHGSESQPAAGQYCEEKDARKMRTPQPERVARPRFPKAREQSAGRQHKPKRPFGERRGRGREPKPGPTPPEHPASISEQRSNRHREREHAIRARQAEFL